MSVLQPRDNRGRTACKVVVILDIARWICEDTRCGDTFVSAQRAGIGWRYTLF
mgnify:CR=1 FL=1